MSTFTTTANKRLVKQDRAATNDTYKVDNDSKGMTLQGASDGDTIVINGLSNEYKFAASGKNLVITSVDDSAFKITVQLKLNGANGVTLAFADGDVVAKYAGTTKKATTLTGDGSTYTVTSKAAQVSDSFVLKTSTTWSANFDDSTTSGGTTTLTLSLNSGRDNLTGSTAADAYTVGLGTFDNGDYVNGSDGVDSISIRDNADNNAVATFVNIEQINLRAMGSGANLDLVDASGYTSVAVWGEGNSADVTNFNIAATMNVQTGFGGDLVVSHKNNGTADTLLLNVNGASAFNLLESSVEFEGLTVTVGGTAAEFVATMDSALQAVNVNGTGDLALTLNRDDVNTALSIKSTALAGNLTLTLGSSFATGAALSAGELLIEAGTGNDKIILDTGSGLARYTGMSVIGGAGTDTVVVGVHSAGSVFPSLGGVENVAINATDLNAGDTAAITFSSLTAGNSISNIEVYGTAADVSLLGLTANAVVAVNSGFNGQLILAGNSMAGTADALTVSANNVGSAFALLESGQAYETITINFHGTAVSAASGNYYGVGSAAVTIGGDVNVGLALSFSGGGVSGNRVDATALAGNLDLVVGGPAGLANLVVNLGSGNDSLNVQTALGGSTTAVLNGGAGTDTLKIDLVANVNPNASNFEAVTLTLNTGAQLNASGIAGMTTLNVKALSSNDTTDVIKMGSALTTINLSTHSAATGVAGRMNFSYDNIAALTFNFTSESGNGSAATAMYSAVDINSAQLVTFNVNGTANVQLGDLIADEASAVTVNVGSDGNGADLQINSGSFVGADLFTLYATAANASINSLSLGCASLVTLHFAHSSGVYSGGSLSSLSAANADLTLEVGDHTGAFLLNSAQIWNDLSVVANNADVTIADMLMVGAGTAASAAGVLSALTGVNVTLNAQQTGDVITLTQFALSSGTNMSALSAINVTWNISGSGNVTINTAGMGGANVGTSYLAGNFHINASGLLGTLNFRGSALNSGIAYSAVLGNDVNSANNVSFGAGADYIIGGSTKDTIEAGLGNDTIKGGNGSDVFVFLSSAGDRGDLTTAQTADVITDFGSGDTIWYSGITTLLGTTAAGNYTSLSGLGTLSAVSTATLVGQALATAGNFLAVYQSNGSTYIEIGTNSAGAAGLDSAVQRIVLDGVTGWTALSSLLDVSVGASGLYIRAV